MKLGSHRHFPSQVSPPIPTSEAEVVARLCSEPSDGDNHGRDAELFAIPPASSEGVLILEPDESVRLLLCRALEYRSIPYWAAATTAEALACIEAAHAWITLIVLEYHLPHESGIDALARLRTHFPAVSAIFLLTDGDSGPLPELRRISGQEVFVKPFSLLSLLGCIERIHQHGPS